MALPTPPEIPREKVEVFGEQVEIRALTRAEALAVRGEGELDLAEMMARIIAGGTDTPLEDVRAWLARVPSNEPDIDRLFARISEMSGVAAEGPTPPASD